MTQAIPYVYRGKVLDVHDGDTVIFDLDVGFGIRLPGRSWSGKDQWSCRVYGINAPELGTPEGKVALAYAQTLLPLGAIVIVTSRKWIQDTGRYWDAYSGRFDGDITLPDGRDFATLMVDSGHAIRKTYAAGTES